MINKNDVLKRKTTSFISALVCASLGMLFVNFGANEMGVSSQHWWIPLFHVEPIYYMSIGIGGVFIVTAIFFVRECFRSE
ncbi:hypothetical protein [Methanococcoides burtonii]|uniref:Group-specific protein n=1 Tax=Methanococcoides burtonii (strain DSM 6242 / NBRC 107633 / OCM 468 / ACE-M) TaxID=259564 RepID=Q12V86_METBU|nr:hypothetical protein [Methanococcoides burtonii]ABE52640.1 Hypothetical protein Mbur_1750 [Methanococcoides burtonii DSM 6242]